MPVVRAQFAQLLRLLLVGNPVLLLLTQLALGRLALLILALEALRLLLRLGLLSLLSLYVAAAKGVSGGARQGSSSTSTFAMGNGLTGSTKPSFLSSPAPAISMYTRVVGSSGECWRYM